MFFFVYVDNKQACKATQSCFFVSYYLDVQKPSQQI